MAPPQLDRDPFDRMSLEGDTMSIWSTDLGYDPSWPAWFTEYRRQQDADLNMKIAAVQRGELTEEGYRAWAMEDARRHMQWLDLLPSDRRAWIDAEDEADRHLVLPSGDARAHEGEADKILAGIRAALRRKP